MICKKLVKKIYLVSINDNIGGSSNEKPRIRHYHASSFIVVIILIIVGMAGTMTTSAVTAVEVVYLSVVA